jgi:hypothetical protein
LSRHTIRKYARADAVEPIFKVPKRPNKLDAFAEKLTAWLRVESGKSRKQKRTASGINFDKKRNAWAWKAIKARRSGGGRPASDWGYGNDDSGGNAE